MDYNQKKQVEQLFKLLSTEIHNNSKNKGWWDKPRNDGEIIALIHSELSEALEALREGEPPDDKLPQHNAVAVELADAVVRILDYSKAKGYNIGKILVDKHEYNMNRSYKHGGKKF